MTSLRTSAADEVYITSQIVDSPRFPWRGALLDVGRHFFPVPFIYKFLDVCAFYKINKFHWHLTEDQVSHRAPVYAQACCPLPPAQKVLAMVFP